MTKKKLREENALLRQEALDLRRARGALHDKYMILAGECRCHKNRCEELSAELQEVKAKYADELQKRLSLADKVRQLENE